jgi:hypothetical protein
VVKVLGFVDKLEVPIRNGGKGANPELVPIVDAAIGQLGEFQKLQVEDKKEGERVRESLRNQLKARGYNVQCATDAKMVTVRKKDGTKEEKLRYYVYLAAFAKDLGNGDGTITTAELEQPAKARKHTKKAVEKTSE